ncbi:MAG: TIGR04551 family protein [Sandaracinus sp.]
MIARSRGPFALALLGLTAALAPASARAQGFENVGQDIEAHDDPDDFAAELDGYLRVRGDTLYDLDLDRGPTPSDQVLFPVPLDDPNGQTLYQADMRLRTDVHLYAPGGWVAAHVRLDFLDNLTLGSTPAGTPVSAVGQRAIDDAVHIRRAWAEVLTPFGVLAAGRMGNQFGLGITANSGDCIDCDGGDAADRVLFATPLADHVWALSFDISSTGPTTPRRSGFRVVDVTPADDVRTINFAVMHVHSDDARERRHTAGRTTVEYGAFLSYRWQDADVPASYLNVAQPISYTRAQVVPRGLSAFAGDVWFRVASRDFRVEAEGALLYARIAQASLLPGVAFRRPLTALQIGAALQTDFLLPEIVSFGVDAGYASGDDAPGFGSFPQTNASAPVAGDIDGPQANPPYDDTIDNFRFHPDFRIDRILFREIIGTVTDAIYLRPHGRLRMFDEPFGTLELHVAAIGSMAVFASSTPGGQSPLGIEIDPSLYYRSREGFFAALDYAVLFPLAGLDNPALDLRAQPAQLVRLRLAYMF